MHRIRGDDLTMVHATSWNASTTGEASTPRGAVVGVGPGPLGRCPAGRGSREFGVSLGAGVSAGGAARTGRQTAPRPAAATVRRAEASACEVADPRPAARGVSDRSLDATARDRADSAGVRRAVSPRACLEGPDRLALELPEARAPRRRARRGRHPSVDAGRVAADKKTPCDG